MKRITVTFDEADLRLIVATLLSERVRLYQAAAAAPERDFSLALLRNADELYELIIELTAILDPEPRPTLRQRLARLVDALL